MTCYVYILYSKTHDKFYFGIMENLSNRLEEHNAGRQEYTAKYKPWEIVWSTEKPNRSEAYKLERKLKNLKSKKRVREFIAKYS